MAEARDLQDNNTDKLEATGNFSCTV